MRRSKRRKRHCRVRDGARGVERLSKSRVCPDVEVVGAFGIVIRFVANLALHLGY